MSAHIFGIRHHGPGSARSLLHALDELNPDAILIEGPPDAEALLPLLVHEQMRPPVALLVYRPDMPSQATFYPFAVFSPEWQALRFALQRSIPVRFMDLPQRFQLGQEAVLTAACGNDDQELAIRADPLAWVAAAAGYSDGERWWEHMIEQRRDGSDIFAAIRELMAALREHLPHADSRETLREAWMRRTIRSSLDEGYRRIAVVCGAWHAPALESMPPEEDDRRLLQGLEAVEVAATWVPWTYDRLSFWSGYGAGVEAPGWYHHLWSAGDNSTTGWLTRIAHLLREQDLDASSAHVIEAVRLAETLSALRNRPVPGLTELNEAAQAVLCGGGDAQLQLIERKLIVGEIIGTVPEETPMLPLQRDLDRLQRKLRLPAEAAPRQLDLDLRKPLDLERSKLLHRLLLLNVPWGRLVNSGGAKRGTFHEHWMLSWQPELAVSLIEANVWGTSIERAATARVLSDAAATDSLPALTRQVEAVLLADLAAAVEPLVARLSQVAAVSSDTALLMQALPPLARVLRYGDVRATGSELVAHVIDGLVARITIGLPAACGALNDDAASAMVQHLTEVHTALAMLQQEDYQARWTAALSQLAGQQSIHGLLAGKSCRLLLELRAWHTHEIGRRMGLALAPANQPAAAAAWVEGFLAGSGLPLLHNDDLWALLDRWVASLPGDVFTLLLPLLRRTFATFAPAERRQMGERARNGRSAAPSSVALIDKDRADHVLPTLALLLGL